MQLQFPGPDALPEPYLSEYRSEKAKEAQRLRKKHQKEKVLQARREAEATRRKEEATNISQQEAQRRQEHEQQQAAIQAQTAEQIRQSREGGLCQMLEKYVGQTIGVNHSDPAKIEPATLVGVNADCFTVRIAEGMLCHFPLRVVLSATTAVADGTIQIGGFFATREYQIVIQVYHMVIYEGSVGVSFEM